MNIPDLIVCDDGTGGTWFDGCKKTPKDYTKIFLLSPRADIDLPTAQADTFDEEARSLLMKKNLLVPINDTLGITEGGAKSNIQVLANKLEIFISQGLYKFATELEVNTCLVESLHKLRKKSWQLILLDSEGQLWFDRKGGKLKGFSINSMVVDNETPNDGGSKAALVPVSFQLTKDGTAGYNSRRSVIVSDEFIDVLGVQDVTISANILVHGTFQVKVVSGCDGSTPVSGLATANFRVRKASDNTTVTVTVAESGDGIYNISGIATAEDVLTQLYDNTNHLDVTDILNRQHYRSNVLASTLT